MAHGFLRSNRWPTPLLGAGHPMSRSLSQCGVVRISLSGREMPSATRLMVPL